jgi:hypothetical protein
MGIAIEYIQKVMAVDPVAGAELITLNSNHITKELNIENPEKNKGKKKK